MVTKDFAMEKLIKGIRYKNQPVYGVFKVEEEGREPELMIGISKKPFITSIPLSVIEEKDFVGKTLSF